MRLLSLDELMGARIVNVSTEPQLQTAMANLQDGDTILLSAGAYNLTSSLYINGRNSITIRGPAGSTTRTPRPDRTFRIVPKS